MDPNVIHLDWERTFEAVLLIIVLAFFIERALAVIFENRIFIERFDRPGVKESIALIVSIAACVYWRFDAISMVILVPETNYPGYFLTGAVVAGGCKASIKLFHDLLDIKSSAHENRHLIKTEHAANVVSDQANEVRSTNSKAKLDSIERTAKKALERATVSSEASGTVAAKEALNRARTDFDSLHRNVTEKISSIDAT